MKILDTPRSGSVAGTTASRNRFGQYYRTRAIPVQPRTPKQTFNRSFLTCGSSQWRSLTDPQRTAWNDYAAQITRSDRMGSGYSPTGASLYTGAVIGVSGTAVTAPPATLPNYVLAIDTMTYVDSTPGPEALTATLVTTSNDNLMLVETSGPVSPGLTSAAAIRRWQSLPPTGENRVRQQFSMSTSPVALLTAYKRLYPSIVSGQVIWFRFRELFYDISGTTPIANRNVTTYRLAIP